MKRHFFLMSLLAPLLLTGCAQDEISPNDDENVTTSFMAVNLTSSDAATRAAAGYEDGSPKENQVDHVRFYFFNSVGGAVNVKLQGGSYVNYYDWTPSKDDPADQTPGTSDDDDIESKLKATIVINTTKGDGIPQRIAAVLNPPTINGNSLLGDESMGLSELKTKVADFANSGLTQAGKFVMFNSVGANGEDLSTTMIAASNLCKDEASALANPVTIYVERSVAKVKVALGDAVKAAAESKLPLKDKHGNNIVVNGKQVYLKLEGWSLTADASEGRLVKKINPGWEGTWWYNTHRSFWAINSMTATNRYHKYTDITTPIGDASELYTNENAQLTDIGGASGAAKNRTKVILKGQLQDATGSPLTLVRHLGVHFADDDNLTELKKSILNQLKANGYTYYSGNAAGTGKDQIGIGDIKIVIAPQKDQENSKNNCYVYAQLTDDAAAKTWYTSNDKDAAPITGAANVINGKLADDKVVDRALVWKSGMTYYYYEIKHLKSSGMIGVVRNHVYSTTVTSIAGLGTPVYDPDQIVYPEKPDENDHFIAAEISILSWRLVPNEYTLEW